MKHDYSFKKTFFKGVVTAVTMLASLAVLTGFSEVVLWDLLVQYLKPILGGLTVGGLITMVANFIKYNYLS